MNYTNSPKGEPMRSLLTLMLLAAAIMPALVLAEPFGYEKGQAISGEPDGQQNGGGLFYQYSHLEFVGWGSVAAYYTHETGVCRVLAVKRASGFNAYGDDRRQAADSLVETLTKKYGAFEKHDYLLPGSILHEPNEWLTAIRKGERVYGYYSLRDDLEGDLLAITVQATYIGLMLEYLFNNFDACREAASDASLSDL